MPVRTDYGTTSKAWRAEGQLGRKPAYDGRFWQERNPVAGTVQEGAGHVADEVDAARANYLRVKDYRAGTGGTCVVHSTHRLLGGDWEDAYDFVRAVGGRTRRMVSSTGAWLQDTLKAAGWKARHRAGPFGSSTVAEIGEAARKAGILDDIGLEARTFLNGVQQGHATTIRFGANANYFDARSWNVTAIMARDEDTLDRLMEHLAADYLPGFSR